MKPVIPLPGPRSFLVALLALAFLAACTTRSDNSEDHRQDGFYGGITGGFSRGDAGGGGM